ncbi:MAG: flotillin family protein, partial [Endozoicomonadaceae bacterium]|nr:flotillin family protein [Endozoicomonadaceae bacterium]
VKMNIVKQLPSIVKESVKPLENIEGIKIIQLDGLNNAIGNGNQGSGGGGNSGGNGGGSLSDQIVDSALRYKAQAPLVDNLLKEIGIDGSSMTSLSEALKDNTSTAKIEKKDDAKTDGDIKKSA